MSLPKSEAAATRLSASPLDMGPPAAPELSPLSHHHVPFVGCSLLPQLLTHEWTFPVQDVALFPLNVLFV